MIEREITFKNNNNKTLSAIIHIPDGEGPFPTVIITHGFKRDKKQIIPLVLSRNLSVNGFLVLRFDFQNCGESEGEFEDLTFSQGIKDIYSALDFIETLKAVDKSRIGLAGLSLGGGLSIIAAAHDPRIKSLIAFSPRVKFSYTITDHFTDEEIEKWKKEGIANYYDEKRDRYWRFKKAFLEDSMKLDGTPLAEQIKIPSLLINGKNDTSVSMEENIEFFKRIQGNKEIFLIDNCDHQFRQVDSLHKAIIKATEWFLVTLK